MALLSGGPVWAGPRPAEDEIRSAGTQPAERISFKPVYSAGQDLVLSQGIHVEMDIPNPGGKQVHADTTMNYEIPLSVGKTETGLSRIEAEVRKVHMRVLVRAGEKRTVTDSNNRGSLRPELAMVFNMIDGMTFQATTTGTGRIVSVDGAEDSIIDRRKKQGEVTPKTTNFRRFCENLESEFADILRQPYVYLPRGQIELGHRWEVKRDIVSPLMGTPGVAVRGKEQTLCKLVDVEETRFGTIASIMLSGEIVTPGKSDNAKQAYQLMGEVRYNLDNGRLVSHEIELDSAGKIRGVGVTTMMRITVQTSLKTAVADKEEPAATETP
ncbi:MAG: hypothetical protein ACLFVU_10375 [Phycisphaerae bacterium]